MANFKVIASLPCTVQFVEIVMSTDYSNSVNPDDEGTFNRSATYHWKLNHKLGRV